MMAKSKVYFISPLATLKTLKMQEVDGRRGLEMKTSSGNWELSSPGFPPLSSNPDQEPKNEENARLRELHTVNTDCVHVVVREKISTLGFFALGRCVYLLEVLV